MKGRVQWMFGRCLLSQWLLCVALAVVTVTAIADTPERILWDKRPIDLQLQIGHERLIHFPDEMRYWLPDSIKHKVSVLAATGVLYLRALEPFPRTRIRVQGLSDQQVFLLDVVAGEVATVGDELIIVTQESVRNLSKENISHKTAEDWRIRLTRYAAQQLYAPERLAGGDSAIKRIALELLTPVPLIRGGLVETVPIASWQGNGLTVTAVKIRNLSMQPLQLRFDKSITLPVLNLNDRLRGDWLTATLQHGYLGLAGSENDTTTLYLVSHQSFLESLKLSPSSTQQHNGEQHDG
jgi:integrating conjugative element protein (TIGR03749 family)